MFFKWLFTEPKIILIYKKIPGNNIAELWEVNKTVSSDFIGQVYNLL